MFYVVLEASKRLTSLNGIVTGDVRKVSKELYNDLDNKDIDYVLNCCEKLLNERKWAFDIIAYDWAYRVRKQYNENTFLIFERWVMEYLTDWYNCDDFCTHALGELLCQRNELFKYIIDWTKSSKFVVRRAAAVVLILPIKRRKYDGLQPFLISDSLMLDEHYLVLKGYGWMLKVLSQVKPEKVIEYLNKNRNNMPRIAFRYALEKFDKETKLKLMQDIK